MAVKRSGYHKGNAVLEEPKACDARGAEHLEAPSGKVTAEEARWCWLDEQRYKKSLMIPGRGGGDSGGNRMHRDKRKHMSGRHARFGDFYL